MEEEEEEKPQEGGRDVLLRWYNGGGGLKVTISCLPPLKSSIYIIPAYYITKMVAIKLNKLKYFGKTHRPLTFPLDEIGQLQFFFYPNML